MHFFVWLFFVIFFLNFVFFWAFVFHLGNFLLLFCLFVHVFFPSGNFRLGVIRYFSFSSVAYCGPNICGLDLPGAGLGFGCSRLGTRAIGSSQIGSRLKG